MVILRIRYRSFFQLIGLYFLILGCSTGEQPQSIETLRIQDATFIKTDSVPLSKLISSDVEIIPLETTPESIFNRLQKVVVTDEYLFILDSFGASVVLQFKRDGTFVQQIGDNGNGPGEYTQPYDMDVADDKIYVLNNGQSVNIYNIQGRFIDSKRLEDFSAFRIIKIDTTRFGFVTGGRDDMLVITDSDFKRAKSHFPFINPSLNRIINHPFTKESGTILFRRYMDPRFYLIDEESGVTPYLKIDFGHMKTPDLNLTAGTNITEEQVEKLGKSSSYLLMQLSADNSRFIALMAEGDPNLYLSDGKSSLRLPYQRLKNDVTFDPRTYPATSWKDQLVFVSSPDRMKTGLEQPAAQSSPYYEKMKTLLDTLPEDANPILMFASLEINPDLATD